MGPTIAALTAAPTAAPIAATTTWVKKDGDGGGADLTVIIIVIAVVGVVLCCICAIAIAACTGMFNEKQNLAKPPPNTELVLLPEEQKTLAPEEISLEEAKPNAHFSL